jgi:hypothetical protein
MMGTDDGRTGGKAVVDVNTKVYGVSRAYINFTCNVRLTLHPVLDR